MGSRSGSGRSSVARPSAGSFAPTSTARSRPRHLHRARALPTVSRRAVSLRPSPGSPVRRVRMRHPRTQILSRDQWLDVEFGAGGDDSLSLGGAIQVEVRLPNPHKGPAGALELALARQVGVVSFGTMPGVTIALHGKAGTRSVHDKVDPVAGDRDLGTQTVPAPEEFQRNVDFEPAFVRLGLVAPLPWRAGVTFEPFPIERLALRLFARGFRRSRSAADGGRRRRGPAA